MAPRPRVLWKGVREVFYDQGTWRMIDGKRTRVVDIVARKLGGVDSRQISPAFLEELQRLMRGGYAKLSGSWLAGLIGRDVLHLARTIKDRLKRRSALVGAFARRVVDGMSEVDWAQLRVKASYIVNAMARPDGIQRQVKGLLHEIAGIRWIFGKTTMRADAQGLMDEMLETVRQAPPGRGRWHPEIFPIERAYARSKSGGGEVGDLIFVAMRDRQDPTKGIWILGTGNQKSASNAHHLQSHKSLVILDATKPDEGITKYGETLGQGSMDIERVYELGIEIPGVGKFAVEPGPGEYPLTLSPRDCLRIGVVPPDTKTGVLNSLRNLENKDRTFRLLISDLSDRDADALAEVVIDAVK